MANTFDYNPKPDGSFWNLSDLNQFFIDLETLIESKLDARGDILKTDLRFVHGGGIINMRDPGEDAGEVIPQGGNSV